jgi:hypothetical protein
MKLMSPWRNRTTSFERCLATRLKPSFSNTGSSVPGWGDANSTNSKPIRPIGFSNRSAMQFSFARAVVARFQPTRSR